ncbi:MAG TPA: DUF1579 family protein [Vicinamibacterales bacterium]|jgi:hypothetical protein|nr:DUF1579 family protein [Vicinamibacterales bacterium]
MKSRLVAAFVVLSVVSLAARGGQQPPPVPKPGPEQAVFKMDEGTWDAVVEIAAQPGMAAQSSKGVEVSTIGCGGLCLITDFKGNMMGAPFHGHGVSVWDAAKKKYVGSWTDSMSPGLAVAESTYDPAKKMMTGTMEGPDMSGQVTKSRSTVEYSTPTTRVMRMYAPGPDGKETEMMKISYTKRK